jgi:hypothetical protein
MLAKHFTCLDPLRQLGGVFESLFNHIDWYPAQFGSHFFVFCGALLRA